jgi:hypothetical protein
MSFPWLPAGGLGVLVQAHPKHNRAVTHNAGVRQRGTFVVTVSLRYAG